MSRNYFFFFLTTLQWKIMMQSIELNTKIIGISKENKHKYNCIILTTVMHSFGCGSKTMQQLYHRYVYIFFLLFCLWKCNLKRISLFLLWCSILSKEIKGISQRNKHGKEFFFEYFCFKKNITNLGLGTYHHWSYNTHWAILKVIFLPKEFQRME